MDKRFEKDSLGMLAKQRVQCTPWVAFQCLDIFIMGGGQNAWDAMHMHYRRLSAIVCSAHMSLIAMAENVIVLASDGLFPHERPHSEVDKLASISKASVPRVYKYESVEALKP